MNPSVDGALPTGVGSRLRALLPGLRHPIIQAPMAGVSTPALAAAVSATGALGALALGALDASAARGLLATMRARTRRPVLYNVFAHAAAGIDATREAAWLARLQPHFAALGAAPPEALTTPYETSRGDDAHVAELVAARVAVASFHFGLPTPRQRRALAQAGIRVWATATSAQELEAAAGAGVDAIVLQGAEAGGHRGDFLPTQASMAPIDALLSAARGMTTLPLIAAGGLMDGRDVAHVLRAGASAAMLGTAFIACPESSASAAHRAALASAAPRTAFTAAISGRPARGIVTRWHDAALSDGVPDYPRAYSAGKALAAAAAQVGSPDWGVHWAGIGAARARALPAAELVAVIMDEARQALDATQRQSAS